LHWGAGWESCEHTYGNNDGVIDDLLMDDGGDVMMIMVMPMMPLIKMMTAIGRTRICDDNKNNYNNCDTHISNRDINQPISDQ
jgi:hypothetical protein